MSDSKKLEKMISASDVMNALDEMSQSIRDHSQYTYIPVLDESPEPITFLNNLKSSQPFLITSKCKFYYLLFSKWHSSIV